MYSKRWFGFAEVDIEVPRDLWEKFEEFPPIFINQSVGAEGVPEHMKDYLAKSGRVATPDRKKLLGVLKTKKVLLYAPLLAWYHEHGLEITAVHRMIDYIPQKIFDWFVQEVANMRRKGDAEAEKALLAEIYKLLGNSAYGKFIEAVERQTIGGHHIEKRIVPSLEDVEAAKRLTKEQLAYILFKGGNCVSEGTTIKPLLGPS